MLKKRVFLTSLIVGSYSSAIYASVFQDSYVGMPNQSYTVWCDPSSSYYKGPTTWTPDYGAGSSSCPSYLYVVWTSKTASSRCANMAGTSPTDLRSDIGKKYCVPEAQACQEGYNYYGSPNTCKLNPDPTDHSRCACKPGCKDCIM